MRLKLIIGLFFFAVFANAQDADMARVSGGMYTAQYPTGGDSIVHVDDFYLDITPVTHAEYLTFVNAHPEWRKSEVKRLFADKGYLSAWTNDSMPEPSLMNSPVNYVSWFAARAYCKCEGKRLPTVDEWEYAAMAGTNKRDARKDSAFSKWVIRQYARHNTHRIQVGYSTPNYWGIQDLHGLVWEWTDNFNAIILSDESRSTDNSIELFCAGGAISASDLKDYAAFLRYAMRSSVKANYTLKNTGFRCAKDAESTENNQP